MASRQGKSKKPSVGNRAQPSLPEDFVLYLDENLHNRRPILEALINYGIKHELHGTYFQPGTEDTDWLPFVGKKGWLLITKDKRIRFNDLEKTAVLRYKVREFYFTSGNYSGSEMADILVASLRDMARFCRRYNAPFIASISKSGKVSLRFPQP